MVEAAAGIMPVGLAMKADMAGVGYELSREVAGLLGNAVAGGDLGQGVSRREVDSIVIKGSVQADNTETKQINDLKKFVNKEVDDNSAAVEHQSKAYFEIDEDDKVIIKVVDSEGKLLKQIPPDEYKKSVHRLKEAYNKIFHKEV
ncbi:Flagellar protein FlaG protein [Candidatus Magnetobacterium bavaricum]|uniref:Flagellar protein FlaG protein n=1 Tax=Candidatus Magnetobacterium bavaricum TaxID=29290 RepID=A0A0F3GJX9_9BACT|nr:Flagellar protein FlaG protein [Candidatus Magnetobacterium bavaricum]